MRENGFTQKKKKKKKVRRIQYPAETIINTDNIALLANTPTQAESLLHSQEQAAGGIGLHVNANKTEYMLFNQERDISTLNGDCLKLVDKFMHFSSSISLTESVINMCLVKAWTAINNKQSYGSLIYPIK